MSEFRHTGERAQDDPAVAETPVRLHMSRSYVVECVDSSRRAALTAMLSSGCRHLALVDGDGTFVGVVSAGAVAPSRCSTLADLADRAPPHLSPDSSIGDAASLMLTHGVDVVGVLDGSGDVVGVLTWSDILETVAGRGRP